MIVSNLTNGFGNNIFQCVAGKLMSSFHKTEHYFLCDENYYAKSFLENLGFKYLNDKKTLHQEKYFVINDNNYIASFDNNYSNNNFLLNGYFENKDYYENNRELILSWFPKVSNKKRKDLVFHFRTGDRLFYKNEFNSKPSPKAIENAINEFSFEKLYIVTDMHDWQKHTPDSISKLNFHLKVKPSESVSNKLAANYFNECYDMLSNFNPIVTKNNVLEDFNFIRTFDNILFQHGTMSWWASFLSDASKVGVYGPWRSWKGDSNKNLSNVKLKEWFKWE